MIKRLFNRKIKKGESFMKKNFNIEVDCANCANKMEEAAKKTEGVKNATINFMAQKILVDFEDGEDVTSVMERVRNNCKKATSDGEIFI